MIAIAGMEPPEDVDLSDLFTDSKIDDLTAKVKPIWNDEASKPEKPLLLEQMEELLPGTKEEKTDLLMIPGDHVVYEEEREISGILGSLFVRPKTDDVVESFNDSITNLEEESNPSGLECSICQEQLSSDRALLEHMRMHTGERYVCKDCPDSFISPEQLHRHRFATHSEKRPRLNCSVCQKTFACRANLEQHLRLHTGERPFSCNQCDKSFMAKERLVRHKKHVHLGQRPPYLECPICYKELSCRKSLNNHMLGHSDDRPRPFVCEECGTSFTAKQTLRVHYRIHAGVLPFVCDVCDHSFRTNSNLLKHIRRKHPEKDTNAAKQYQCSVCLIQLTTWQLLTEHMRIHTGERPFSCKKCDEKFISLKQLSVHHEQKHLFAEDPPVHDVKCTVGQKEITQEGMHDQMQTHAGVQPYSCIECNLHFASYEWLRRHLKSSSHLEKSMVSCSYCQEKFTSKQKLKEHMKSHTADKYTCSECGKVLKNKMDYNRHMMIHTGERPYSCEECEFTSCDRQTLKHHRMRHTGERPHVCGECGHGFVAKAHLNQHLRRVHLNLISVERTEDDSVVLEASAVSTEDGASGATTQDSDSESDLKPLLAPFDMLNECITNNEQKPVRDIASEKRRDSESTSRVPELKVSVERLPEVKQEETDRLVVFGGSMDYEDEVWSSEVAEPQTNRLEEHIPAAKQEALDGLVRLREPMSYEEEAGTSGVRKLLRRGSTSARNRKRKRPFDFDAENGSAPSRVQWPREPPAMEQPLPEVKEEEIDQFVMFADTSIYNEEAGTSGTAELPSSEEAPFDFPYTEGLREPKQEVMEEQLSLEIKEEEETDRLVIVGGRVVSVDVAGTSGIEEDLFPNPEGKAPDLLIDEDVTESALALFAKQRTSGAPNGITANSGISDLQCSVCYTHFATRQALYKHLCTPSGEIQFPCDICDAIYPLADGLRSHLLTHGVDNAEICDECGKILKGEKRMDDHKLTHTGERAFECHLCDQRFPNKQSLRSHVNSHTVVKGQKKTGNSVKYTLMCEHCKYKTTFLRLMRFHLKQKHGISTQSNKERQKKSKKLLPEPGFKIIEGGSRK